MFTHLLRYCLSYFAVVIVYHFCHHVPIAQYPLLALAPERRLRGGVQIRPQPNRTRFFFAERHHEEVYPTALQRVDVGVDDIDIEFI